MAKHRIAVIPGDGIGKEVMPEALKVLKALGQQEGIDLQLDHFDFASCDYYVQHGKMMPDDWKAQIGGHDAILYGAVGWPDTVPDHISLWGSLLLFRREFDQYINLRPVRLMPGVPCPLANRQPGEIDFYVVRENTEGEYSSLGGRMFPGTDREVVIQESIFTRIGVDRVLKYAFELARSRPKRHLTSATKSNGIFISMPYWDERVAEMAKGYADVKLDKFHIDILTAHFVRNPHWFDVVVASNLFGDILSDLGPACTGTIGIAPSANINPERRFPFAVRTGARFGARHRRQGHREPDRADLVLGDDAAAPRPSEGSRPDPGGCRKSHRAWAAHTRHGGQGDDRRGRVCHSRSRSAERSPVLFAEPFPQLQHPTPDRRRSSR